MSKRLGGRKIEVERMADRTYVHKVASMEEAMERYKVGTAMRRTKNPASLVLRGTITASMLSGDNGLESILTQADQLIDEAIIEDPRLARKPSWVLAEEGIDGCAALIAAGEERAFLDRRRLRLADTATAEPCRVVISTDSKDITPSHAAAFIAATKLAQQFRPLELWWQGAWLIESGPHTGHGFVFLVPLVQGDMDYRRLQFVLSSEHRDRASFQIMFSYAKPLSMGWGGGVGEYSYLENTFHFVRESGIRAEPCQVAAYAAHWAGLEAKYRSEIYGNEAEQHWQPADETSKWKGPSDEDRRRWAEDDKRRELEARRRAEERLERSVT